MYDSDVRRPDGLTFLGIALAGIGVLGILLALASFAATATVDQQMEFFDSVMDQSAQDMGDDSIADAVQESRDEMLAQAQRWRPYEMGIALLQLLLGSAMVYGVSKVWRAQPASNAWLNKVLALAVIFAFVKFGFAFLQAQAMQPMVSEMMGSMTPELEGLSAEETALMENIAGLSVALGIGFSFLGAAIKTIFYVGSMVYLRGSTVNGYLTAANDDGLGGEDWEAEAVGE